MPKPEQGRIILVEVVDPQDRNAKTRPAVIVSRNDEIQSEGLIACVAVTIAVPDAVPEDCILLPFQPAGKSRTGLRQRSAAMCSWLFEISEDKIIKFLGVTPPTELEKIISWLEKQKSS